MREAAHTILALMLIAIPSAAQACAVMNPPSQRIAAGYREGTIKAAATVTIESAQHSGERGADFHPWKAKARVLRGNTDPGLPRLIEFERGWGSSACEWNLPPLPKKGDRWVVYFWKDGTGKYRPWLALPQFEARHYDPKMRTAD